MPHHAKVTNAKVPKNHFRLSPQLEKSYATAAKANAAQAFL